MLAAGLTRAQCSFRGLATSRSSGFRETVSDIIAMKTAVSLPDDLFRMAEAAARRLQVSRSELYARAITEL